MPTPACSTSRKDRSDRWDRAGRARWWALPLVVALFVGAGTIAGPGVGPAVASEPGRGTVTYRLPVASAVLRAFMAPETAYGAGHRGVDLAASPGAPVRVAAAGRIHHAGVVVGVGWVSVDHPDGLRTSYGPLAPILVHPGQEVSAGDVIGLVAARDHGDPSRDQGLHFGVRRGVEYLDPMLLPGIGVRRPSLVDAGSWWGSAHVVTPYAPWAGGRIAGVLTSPSPTAERAGYAVPPNPNHLVLIAGLGTSSGQRVLDASHLGVAPESTTHFSYGGRDGGWEPAASGSDPGPRRDQLPYGPADTWEGVERAALLLRDQLRAIARREPGRAVDLVGHSMGGVVAAYYLLHLHDPYAIDLPPIGNVVTLASPLDGSDVARAGSALIGNPSAGGVVRAVWAAGTTAGGGLGQALAGLHPDAAAIPELAAGSVLVAGLADAWARALQDGSAGPLATGTRILSVAGSLDAVVGADRAALSLQGTTPGGATASERRVLPGGHMGVLTSEAVREVTWQFLAGREVVASPGHLATGAASVVGGGLTVLSALLGDASALEELPFPLMPVLP